MITLALDTALAGCSVAVLKNGEILAFQRRIVGRGQAEILMPMLIATLTQAQVGFVAIDLLAVTVGPGAFTGIRIGLAAAHGLALALERPLVGISTLHALAAGVAAQVRGDGVVAAIDARRGDVYMQVFDAGLRPAAPPCRDSAAGAAKRLPPGHLSLVGSGGPLLLAQAQAGAGWTLAGAPDDPDARIVGLLAESEPHPPAADAGMVLPLYLETPAYKTAT